MKELYSADGKSNKYLVMATIHGAVRRWGDSMLTDDQIDDHFKFRDMEVIKCEYCKKRLIHRVFHKPDDNLHKAAPSIDHKIPQAMNGSGELENFAVCCHECNVIKGSLTAKTFKRLLKAVDEYDERHGTDMREAFLDEWWFGRLAETIQMRQVTEGPK